MNRPISYFFYQRIYSRTQPQISLYLKLYATYNNENGGQQWNSDGLFWTVNKIQTVQMSANFFVFFFATRRCRGWSRNLQRGGRTRSLPLHFLSPSPLKIDPLKPARGMRNAVSSPSGVPGAAPAENAVRKPLVARIWIYSEYQVLRVWRNKLVMVSA